MWSVSAPGIRPGGVQNHESTGFKVETLFKYSWCDAESPPTPPHSHASTHVTRESGEWTNTGNTKSHSFIYRSDQNDESNFYTQLFEDT